MNAMDSANENNIYERTLNLSLQLLTLCDELQRGDGAESVLGEEMQKRATAMGVRLPKDHEYPSDDARLDALGPVLMAAAGAEYYLELLNELHIIHPMRLGILHQECKNIVTELTGICDEIKGRMR